MRPSLTEKQAKALGEIVQHVEDYGYPPTVRVLAQLLGVTSTSTAHSHLQALEHKGYIEWPHGRDALGYRIVGARYEVHLPEEVAQAMGEATMGVTGW